MERDPGDAQTANKKSLSVLFGASAYCDASVAVWRLVVECDAEIHQANSGEMFAGLLSEPIASCVKILFESRFHEAIEARHFDFHAALLRH